MLTNSVNRNSKEIFDKLFNNYQVASLFSPPSQFHKIFRLAVYKNVTRASTDLIVTMKDLAIILFTCLLGLLFLVAIIYLVSTKKKQKSAKGNKIYLLGPKSCGKTQFFLKTTLPPLKSGENPILTVTSILPSEFVLDNNSTLVDTPGHKRLRPEIGELKEAKYFILWISGDSLTSDTEYLLRLFNKSLKDEIPVAVVSALPKDKIQAALEECVDRIYKTESDHAICEFNLTNCKLVQSIDEIDNIKVF
jgi:signal recognition particle receptor subunit beta